MWHSARVWSSGDILDDFIKYIQMYIGIIGICISYTTILTKVYNDSAIWQLEKI